jgi:hypothetical protein
MAGSTPLGFPYPTGTDRVMDGDNAMQSLATAVDTFVTGKPRGRVAAAIITANVGAGGAETALAGLTVTFTAVASRWYRLTGFVNVQPNAANDTWGCRIRQTVLAGTQIAYAAVAAPLTTQNYALMISALVQPGAGSVTYLLSGHRVGGTGTFSAIASATAPCFFLAEDIGV